ncbi:Mor transcription activator family protein [compost metagenome]
MNLFDEQPERLDPAQVLAHMDRPSVINRWEGTLVELVDITELALRERLGERGDHLELARHVAYAICNTMGGGVFYLPRGDILKRAMRNSALYEDWRDGKSEIPELAKRYGLTWQSAYRIINRQRALQRRSEPDLFGFGPGEEQS